MTVGRTGEEGEWRRGCSVHLEILFLYSISYHRTLLNYHKPSPPVSVELRHDILQHLLLGIHNDDITITSSYLFDWTAGILLLEEF